MTDKGLPCVDLLEATPGILRGLMSELTDDDARWKPASDRFSVAEVLAHLSHSEGHCYRMRLDCFLAETRPTFEPDDAQMYWTCTGTPTRRMLSTTSRSSAKPTSHTCAICLPRPATGWRCTRRPARSREPDAPRMGTARPGHIRQIASWCAPKIPGQRGATGKQLPAQTVSGPVP